MRLSGVDVEFVEGVLVIKGITGWFQTETVNMRHERGIR